MEFSGFPHRLLVAGWETKHRGLPRPPRPRTHPALPKKGGMGWGKVPLPESEWRFYVFTTYGGKEAEKLFPTWTQNKMPAVQNKRMVSSLKKSSYGSSYTEIEPIGHRALS